MVAFDIATGLILNCGRWANPKGRVGYKIITNAKSFYNTIESNLCKTNFLFFFFFFIFTSSPFASERENGNSYRVVTVPVTDLRQTPINSSSGDQLVHDSLQETQLLYGEKVLVLEKKEGWSRVEALNQPEWTHHEKWEGYPGWVFSNSLVPLPISSGWEPDAVIIVPLARVYQEPSNDSPVLLELFMGTKIMMDSHAPRGSQRENEMDEWRSIQLVDDRTGWIQKNQIASFSFLRQLSLDQLRQQIIRNAKSLEGKPYYWGGLSRGVDCSGLVHLAYRAAGIDLPRDAHEQFMKSKMINTPAGATLFDGDQDRHASPLQLADLVFLSSEEDPNRISHVMLYSGNGNIIEGTGTGKFVHQISLNEKLSQNSHRKVYYAAYFPKN